MPRIKHYSSLIELAAKHNFQICYVYDHTLLVYTNSQYGLLPYNKCGIGNYIIDLELNLQYCASITDAVNHLKHQLKELPCTKDIIS